MSDDAAASTTAPGRPAPPRHAGGRPAPGVGDPRPPRLRRRGRHAPGGADLVPLDGRRARDADVLRRAAHPPAGAPHRQPPRQPRRSPCRSTPTASRPTCSSSTAERRSRTSTGSSPSTPRRPASTSATRRRPACCRWPTTQHTHGPHRRAPRVGRPARLRHAPSRPHPGLTSPAAAGRRGQDQGVRHAREPFAVDREVQPLLVEADEPADRPGVVEGVLVAPGDVGEPPSPTVGGVVRGRPL